MNGPMVTFKYITPEEECKKALDEAREALEEVEDLAATCDNEWYVGWCRKHAKTLQATRTKPR